MDNNRCKYGDQVTVRVANRPSGILRVRITTTKTICSNTSIFLGADQKVTRSYKWGAGTVEMNRP